MSGGRRCRRHIWRSLDIGASSRHMVCHRCGAQREETMMTTGQDHLQHARELERYRTLRRYRCPHCAREWRDMGIAPDWSTRETVDSPDTTAARAHMRECTAALEVRS